LGINWPFANERHGLMNLEVWFKQARTANGGIWVGS
jgi:hypothetical protein